MDNLIYDLHLHPGLKGYGSSDHPDTEGMTIWDHFPERKKELNKLNPILRAAIKDLAKDSQANFDACASSGLMVPFIALYPIERQMFTINPRGPLHRIFKMLIKGKQLTYLGSAVTGFPEEKVQAILNNIANDKDEGVHYFNELIKERDYMIAQTQTTSNGFKFQIASDYKNLKTLLADGKTIAGIFTVEGAHAFGNYLHNSTFTKLYNSSPGLIGLRGTEKLTLESSFLKNIAFVKQSEDKRLVPFFVTFCHHFNNLLAGHARSMSDKTGVIKGVNWPKVPGMRHLFDQEPGLNEGFSDLGLEVMSLLFDKEKGRRILIDGKHMSIKTRKTFYEYIRTRREVHNDPIPIIHSHSAINGWPTLDEAAHHEEDADLDKGQFFSRWQINLTNEDILETFDSDGLIGVVLHEGRMPGDAFKEKAKKLKKKIKKADKKPQKKAQYKQELRDLYLKLVWSNIFHIIKTVHDQREGANGWKMVALGSDYDGLVDPFDLFDGTSEFMVLREEMINYLNAKKEIFFAEAGEAKVLPNQEVDLLMFGKTPEELLKDVFHKNTDQFLSKYFTAGYLEMKEPKPTSRKVTPLTKKVRKKNDILSL